MYRSVLMNARTHSLHDILYARMLRMLLHIRLLTDSKLSGNILFILK